MAPLNLIDKASWERIAEDKMHELDRMVDECFPRQAEETMDGQAG